MNVLIVHNAVDMQAPPDERDVLDQVDAVAAGLRDAGHGVSCLAFADDVTVLVRTARESCPDVVFNLVEMMDGDERRAFEVVDVLESAGFPVTGSRAAALYLAGDKLLAKVLMEEAGIPSPEWVSLGAPPPGDDDVSGRWIVKSVDCHGSVGLGEGAVITAESREELLRGIRERSGDGSSWFAEKYVDGREFAVSLLFDGGRPEVIGVAEIEFVDYAPDAVKIVDFDAKWSTDSFVYTHTPRRFDFPDSDLGILEDLRGISVRVCETLGLGGYVRVDFRVGAGGEPFVIDVNANPCLSADAGYVAAALRSGHTLGSLMDAIVKEARGAVMI